MFDCAIIGTGPAGLSAAINLKLHEKNFIWFGNKTLGGKTALAEKVANYPGFPMVTGAELARAFAAHADALGLEITDKMVSQISSTRQGFALLAENDLFQAKTLILAIGVVSARPLPGELDLVGRGVSYCATCDGFLYRGKTIGIVCRNPRFAHEIQYLAALAGTVYLFSPCRDLSVAGETIHRMDAAITSVNGGTRLESVSLSDGTELPLDALFCMRDAIVPSTLLPGLLTEKGAIPVERGMGTNLPGCFACGDCTGAPYQFTKAVGEGNVAAHSVIRYLSDHGGE